MGKREDSEGNLCASFLIASFRFSCEVAAAALGPGALSGQLSLRATLIVDPLK